MQTYLINALVGAFIGAWTNDIAVRMIFWVVLPRRKKDVARTIQEVVSQELLAPEKITEKFASDSVRLPLRHAVDKWLAEMLSRDLPSWIELTEDKREKFAPKETALLSELMDEFFEHAASDDFRELTIQPILAEKWREYKNTPISVVSPGAVTAVIDRLPQTVRKCVVDSLFLDHAAHSIADMICRNLRHAKTLGEATPPGLRGIVRELVTEQAPLITELLASAVEKPDTRQSLVHIVEKAIKDNASSATGIAGTLTAMAVEQFVDADAMVDRLPGVIRAIDKREVGKALQDSIDNLWNERLQNVLGDLSEERVRKSTVALLELVANEDNAEALGNYLKGQFRAVMEREPASLLTSVAGPGVSDDWLNALSRHIQHILVSHDAKVMIRERVIMTASKAKATPIGKLGRFINAETSAHIAESICEMAIETARERLSLFAEQCGIWDIVGDSINQYDNKQLENIIRTIANRELHSITVLGGVIGFVIGLIQTAMMIQ